MRRHEAGTPNRETLAVSETLFAFPYAPCLAVGIGERGGRAAAAGRLDGFGEGMVWAACDAQPARLLSTGLERKLLLEIPASATSADLRPTLNERHAEELDQWAAHHEVAVLLGAYGEPAAALMAPLAEALRARGVFVWSLGLPALPFEDAAYAIRAEQTEADLLSAADVSIALDPQSVLAPLGPNPRLAQAYAAAEAALLGAAQALLGAWVGGVDGPAPAASDWRDILRGRGPVRARWGSASGPDAPAEACDAALEGSLEQDSGDTRAALLVCGRELTLGEVALLGSRLGGEGAAGPVRLALGFETTLASEARCLILARAALSQNVVSLAAGR